MSTCIALRNPIFQPAMRIITAITNSFPALVTTSFEHQYKSGTIVRIDVPVADGMQQINQQTGSITVVSSTTFTIPIDTTHYDAFSIPVAPGDVNTCAMVVPIGEINEILTAAVQNVLPYPAT